VIIRSFNLNLLAQLMELTLSLNILNLLMFSLLVVGRIRNLELITLLLSMSLWLIGLEIIIKTISVNFSSLVIRVLKVMSLFTDSLVLVEFLDLRLMLMKLIIVRRKSMIWKNLFD